MMNIKRIIEIANELDTGYPYYDDDYMLKVYESLRRAIVKQKLDFVQYLLVCTPEERRPIYHAYQLALRDVEVRVNGVIKEGYEDAYRVYEMMCEEQGINVRF